MKFHACALMMINSDTEAIHKTWGVEGEPLHVKIQTMSIELVFSLKTAELGTLTKHD